MHRYLQNSARLRTPATCRPSLQNRNGKRRLLCTAFLALIAIGPLTEVQAQVYDFNPEADILGKSQEEHAEDFVTWFHASRGNFTHTTTERLYENQRGPVFFLTTDIQSPDATRETAIPQEVIDVQYGAPIASFYGTGWGWDHGDSNCAEARSRHRPSMFRLGQMRNKEERYAEAEAILKRLLTLLPHGHRDIDRAVSEIKVALTGQGKPPDIRRLE